jgi:hypothetical protein
VESRHDDRGGEAATGFVVIFNHGWTRINTDTIGIFTSHDIPAFLEKEVHCHVVRWQNIPISIGDITKLMLWSPGSEVELSVGDDPIYPISIRRVLYDFEEVLARDPSSPSGLGDSAP